MGVGLGSSVGVGVGVSAFSSKMGVTITGISKTGISGGEGITGVGNAVGAGGCVGVGLSVGAGVADCDAAGACRLSVRAKEGAHRRNPQTTIYKAMVIIELYFIP